MLPIAKVVAARSKKRFADKSEVEELRCLEKEWLACFNAANVLYTETAAKAAWVRQNAEQAVKFRKGEAVNRAYSFEDIKADYATRSATSKRGMVEAATDALPIIKKILERFLATVETTLDDVERAEAADYQEWGLPYTPTAKVRALRDLKDAIRARIPTLGATAWGRPSESVPFIEL
jgi:hypothetical protein